MPVYVHVIDHPDARVLVDTGMTELHPAVADLRQPPLRRQADLRPASGARRRAQRGRLHHS
jgi:N-acyl homoserine lactone hydrolase